MGLCERSVYFVTCDGKPQEGCDAGDEIPQFPDAGDAIAHAVMLGFVQIAGGWYCKECAKGDFLSPEWGRRTVRASNGSKPLHVTISYSGIAYDHKSQKVAATCIHAHRNQIIAKRCAVALLATLRKKRKSEESQAV